MDIASAACDKTDSGKKSTGNTVVGVVNERSESQKDVDSSKDEPKNVDRKVNDVQKENLSNNGNVIEMGVTQLKRGLGYIYNSMVFRQDVVILIVVAVVVGAVAVYIRRQPEREMKSDFELVKLFENDVNQLQLSFTNQTERFWKMLKNSGLGHLRNNNPSRPLVFMLVAPPPAHEWVDCLATKLAEMLDPRHKGNLTRIDGADKKGYPADQVEKEMNDYLDGRFNDDHRVAVIHRLELLPPPSPQSFHSYCDNQDAPYKRVAIIFTVHLPEEPKLSLSPKEAEAAVEKYLLEEVWLRDDMDSAAALLNRIAEKVALMNGESSDSLKAHCFRIFV